MKKYILWVSLVLFPTMVFAEDSAISLYGLAFIGFENVNSNNETETDIKSYNSRFGAKGASNLNSDIEVFYKLEFGVDFADESGEKNFKSRNQYVGLRGAFGDVLIGRYDTALKLSQGKIDLFNHQEGDLKFSGAWKGENRMSDSLSYKSPKFNDFHVGLTYVSEEEGNGDAGTSIALYYGDKNLKKNMLYAAIAYDADIKGYDTIRAAIQMKFQQFKVGVIYQEQEDVESNIKDSGVLASVSYTFNNITIKGQLQDLEKEDAASIGLDYKLSKKTKLFIFYTKHDLSDTYDNDWLSLGIHHKF